MAVHDRCFILHRFPAGLSFTYTNGLLSSSKENSSLITKLYCCKFGQRTLLVPEYFGGNRYRLGSFEPFNEVELYMEETNGVLKPVDIISVKFHSREAASNFRKFFFLSKVAETILNFVKYPDRAIFELLDESLTISDFFNFNLIRFWLNLANVLGFSVENLNRAGWINVFDLGVCSPDEIGRGYCIFIPPKVLVVLKNISRKDTKPFHPQKEDMERIEKFFKRFFSLQVDNF